MTSIRVTETKPVGGDSGGGTPPPGGGTPTPGGGTPSPGRGTPSPGGGDPVEVDRGGGGTTTSGGPAPSATGTTSSPGRSPASTDGAGPLLVRVHRFGVHDQRTRLVLQFSQPVDPTRATAPVNYKVVAAGRDGVLGDRDDVIVPISRAVYLPNSREVALTRARRIDIHHRYRLTVRGSGSSPVANQAGRPLEGGDRTVIVTWKDLILPKPGGRGVIGLEKLRHLVWPGGQ